MRVLRTSDAALGKIANDVAEVVRAGGLAIFPTDTVYGIGCNPENEAAVERIFAAKRRPEHKPLSLHFGDVAALEPLIGENALAQAAARAFLPGPLTLIVTRPAKVGAFVTRGLPTLGLRVPDHAVCAALLRVTGPLAATSANYSGASAHTGRGAVTDLPAADVVIDDGPTAFEAESTIIDVTGVRPRLVREGAMTIRMLEETLGSIERVR